MPISRLEAFFDAHWKSLGGPALTAEHHFAAPARRWRFDRAYLPAKVAVELEGGVFCGGRHTRGAGYEKDCEKYNAAVALGWRVWRLTKRLITPENLAPILAACQPI